MAVGIKKMFLAGLGVLTIGYFAVNLQGYDTTARLLKEGASKSQLEIALESNEYDKEIVRALVRAYEKEEPESYAQVAPCEIIKWTLKLAKPGREIAYYFHGDDKDC